MQDMKLALDDAERAFTAAEMEWSYKGPPLKFYHRLGECQLKSGLVVDAKVTVAKAELRAATDIFSDFNWVTRINDLMVRIKKARKHQIHSDPLEFGSSFARVYATTGGNTDDRSTSATTLKTNFSKSGTRSLRPSPVQLGGRRVLAASKVATPFSPPITKNTLDSLPDMGEDRLSPLMTSGHRGSPISFGGYNSDDSVRSSDVDSVVSRVSRDSEYSFRGGWSKTLAKTEKPGSRRSQKEQDEVTSYVNDRKQYTGVSYPVYRRKSHQGLLLKNHDSIDQLEHHVYVIANEDDEMRRCRALFSMLGKGS